MASGGPAKKLASSSSSKFDVLDGRRIRELAQDDAEFTAALERAFQDLDVDSSGALSRSELRPAFLKLARLLGLPAPGSLAQLDTLVDLVFTRDAHTQAQAQEDEEGPGSLRKAEFVAVMKQILVDIAAMLQEDPLFVAVFNGVVLKEVAAKPEALQQIVDQAFHTLDKDKSGRLSRAELLPVLKLLSGGGSGLPLPPKEVIEKLEEGIIAEFGQGGKELSREEFEALFKELMLFMASSLEAEPAMYVREATVLNGYALKKLVSDDAAFKKEADELFKAWDRSSRGKLSRADVGEGLKRLGLEIGLPPVEAKEAEQIYSELFTAADFDSSGFVDREEFELLLRALLLSLAAQLEKSPVVVDCAVSKLESIPGSKLSNGVDLLDALRDKEKIRAVLNERFDTLDANGNGTLSKGELRPALLRLAQLLGLPPPGSQEQMDRLLDELFKAVVSEDFSEEVDRERFIAVSQEILQQVADSLEADPLMTVSLDGSRLSALVADAEEFQRLSDSVFDSLDADKDGNLSMAELKPALQELGLALGIPPAGVREEGDAIVAAAVAEYGEGRKELTRAAFAALLKDILNDIAVRLSNSPVVVGQSVKVLNGSRLRKLLANESEFRSMVEELFNEWDQSNTGRLSRGDLIAGLKKLGMVLGLPPPKAKDADRVYQHLFMEADMDDSGFVDRKEFLDFMRLVFVQIASELEKNPLVLEATLVAYS